MFRVKVTILFLLIMAQAFATDRQIAITIDDLPFVGGHKNYHLNQLIETIRDYDIPVTGFIIADNVEPGHMKTLQKFRDAGLGLGNHTASHINLNQVSSDEYIEDVDRADKKLSSILTSPKFFRYPYLAIGKNEKKRQVLDYLKSHNYHIAPITIDSHDYIFNQKLLQMPITQRRDALPEIKENYLSYIWKQTLRSEKRYRNKNKAQILLIHANILNAEVLGDILDMYIQQGYAFVSLEQALSMPYEVSNSIHSDQDDGSIFEW